MSNRKYLMFVDAETDGLQGEYISIAAIVTDRECNEIDRIYIGTDRNNLVIEDAWTRENVLPILGDYDSYQTEADMLSGFWDFWMKYGSDAYVIGDVIFPVEARLFQRCIDMDKDARTFQGPFPLLDLSSILFAKGIDPLEERQSIIEGFGYSVMDGKQHNALYDVDVSIMIYKKLIVEGE